MLKSFIPRTEFPPHNVTLANFAAHHRQALADLKRLGRQVDIVLEMRDSRAPLSSINPLIGQALPGVPKLVLYTKRDIGIIKESIILPMHPEKDFRMVDVTKRKYASRVLREMKNMAEAQIPKPPLGFKALVCGMPNAGKSTFINQFRRICVGNREYKKVARTGSMPGVTRAVSEQIMISWDPRIYVLDTPGVLMPQVYDWEHMLKLCLIGAVPRGLVDPVVLADYLLFHLNRQYPLGGRYPGDMSNDIHEVLWNLAHTNRRNPKWDTWDPNMTASEWVDRYIRGGIGKLMLDDLSIDNVERTLARMKPENFAMNDFLPQYQKIRRSV